MDFVFDRTAEGRSIKSLTVVDDATHEAVAIVAERALGGQQLVRTLEQLARSRGLPKAIRTDNGKEFCSRVMVNWAHARGVQLFLIEPGKPNHCQIKSELPHFALLRLLCTTKMSAYPLFCFFAPHVLTITDCVCIRSG